MLMEVKTFRASKPLERPEGTYRKGELKEIVKINEKGCWGCQICHTVCPTNAIEGKFGEAQKINYDKCIYCGQCLINCPYGVIEQMSFVDVVLEKLNDKNTKVVAILAPAVRVAIAEEFGKPPGTLTVGQLWYALKKAGFLIYENNFAADQTILEEGTELLKRIVGNLGFSEFPIYVWDKKFIIKIKKEYPLPQFTSCCPAWVRYVEIYYPELIPYLSSCKSPQQMAGATAKTFGAKYVWNVEPKNLFTVGIMPCTAKIFEASRPEFNSAGHYWRNPEIRDVDAVLTTRDLATIFKKLGINPLNFPKKRQPKDFEWYSGAATIFGTSGGVMEAALRFAFHVLSGLEPSAMSPKWDFEEVRGDCFYRRTAAIKIPLRKEYKSLFNMKEIELKVCVVNGIGPNGGHIKDILTQVKENKSPYHFIEVMACPGGCLNGGGQPKHVLVLG